VSEFDRQSTTAEVRSPGWLVAVGWCWAYVPPAIIILAWLLGSGRERIRPAEGADWSVEHIVAIMLFMGMMLIAAFWSAVTVPQWRSWAMARTDDPEKLTRLARVFGIIPFRGFEFLFAEIRLPASIYYTGLAGVLVIAFLVVETIASEYLEEKLGVPGYTGAILSAAFAALLGWPVSTRLRRMLETQKSQAVDEDTAADALREMRSGVLRLVVVMIGALAAGTLIGWLIG
jgi:hypothetical protein